MVGDAINCVGIEIKGVPNAGIIVGVTVVIDNGTSVTGAGCVAAFFTSNNCP